MNDNLLENLNSEQLKAVQHSSGPLLIIAGAGTGKTTVVTQRIAYLIEQGKAEADEILALTFTEKAAGEMEERVDRLLPLGYVDLWISTFHSFGEKILNAHGLDIGLPTEPKLLNEFEQYALIKNNLDLFELDYYRPLGNPTKFVQALLKHFSRLKDEDISTAAYLSYADELKLKLDKMLRSSKKKSSLNFQFSTRQPYGQVFNFQTDDIEVATQEVNRIGEVARAYKVYQQLLLDNNALDFGDLINYTLKLFRERPLILEKYRKQFKYILLDEFQDTNWAQYELIKLLASPKNNLVVVGDDDQCLPGDAKITVPIGKKRIDKIKKGELVASAIGKGYLSYSQVNYVNKVKKKARLITFETSKGYEVKVTDNHKMFAFVPQTQYELKKHKKHKSFYYVYLMHKQELGWRIGITQDLAVRLKLERSADKIIAIEAHNTEAEARYREIFLSLKYGIPTICFKERNGIMDQKIWSEKLYKELDVRKAVIGLANDLKIDLSAHQVSLEAVNRGQKVRIKINLEMCYRRYRSKYAKDGFLDNPQVLHQLSLETSHKETIEKIKKNGFKMIKAKKGERIKVASADLKELGKMALKLQKITGGIIENRMNVGRVDVQHRKAVVVPAGNVLPGMYLPVSTKEGIVYDQIVTRKEENKNLIVYDLEVDRSHNFVANNIVVHNSVYKFRGASVSNILQFKKDFKKSKEIVLTKNYRNAQEILDLSYDFIQLNNPNRLEFQLNLEKKELSSVSTELSSSRTSKSKKLSKRLESQKKDKGVIEIIEGENLQDEIRQVVEKIADIRIKLKNKISWSEFAILVRANNSAKEICSALDASGLPYQFLASRGLYIKPIIIDIVAYLKLLDDYHEGAAMYRVLKTRIFNFSDKEIVDLNFVAKKKSWSLFNAVKTAGEKLGAGTAKKCQNLLNLINKHTALARNQTVLEIFLAFLNDSGYLKHISELDEEKAKEQISYLNQFKKRIEKFMAGSDDKSVTAFIKELDLEIDAGGEGSIVPDIESGPEAIKVMTIHAAKGLEFKHVFLPNMVDKRFPSIARREAIQIPDDLVKEVLSEGDVHLEEERRLMYVAMTRAGEGLYLSWSRDYGGARNKKPSRFLLETKLLNSKNNNNIKLAEKADNLKIINREFGIPSEVNYQKPTYFSFSKLTAFINCPYQYRFNYVLKVPTRNKHYFSFGKTMHSTLQKIFQLVQSKSDLGQGNLFDKQKKVLKEKLCDIEIEFDEVKKLYEESWIDEWYLSDKQKKEYFKKGQDTIKEFLRLHNKNWPKTSFLEKGFKNKIKFKDEHFTLTGAIDRVDEVDGKIKIVDYKTGSPKEKLSFDDKFQLLIYQQAVQDIFREEIHSLVFYYLEDNTEIEFLGTEKELAKSQEKIIKTITDIHKNEFPPKPSQLCKFCDFYDICEYRKG